jgi:hypothetical protein
MRLQTPNGAKRATRLLLALSLTAFGMADAQNAPGAGAIKLRLDYGGAEVLLDALERPTLSDADVDSLMRVPGLRAMVDNVTRFVPGVGIPQFREGVKAFARTKRAEGTGAFQLTDVWRARDATRSMLQEIRAREQELIGQALAQTHRYRLNTGPLTIAVYFVAGGVSDGFVFDHRTEPAFYVNLTRSNGDMNGLVSNLAHETYHVMQKAAQRRVPGLAIFADSSEQLSPPIRLLTVTLSEGLANYGADPLRTTAPGRQIEQSRKRFLRHARPSRITENFARFDRVLRDLRAQRVSWTDAYDEGFSSDNDASFYFVGYQMAKAIEQHCGNACLGRLFEQHPIEFFRQYIALYKTHPGIRGRFSAETEGFLLSR